MKLNILVVGIFLALVTGCTFRSNYIVSSQSLGEKYEKPIGVVRGEASAFYFLFFGPFGDDSLTMAVSQSINKSKADSLVNVFAERSTTFYPFFWLPIVTVQRTTLVGTAVSYINMQGVNTNAVSHPETGSTEQSSPVIQKNTPEQKQGAINSEGSK